MSIITSQFHPMDHNDDNNNWYKNPVEVKNCTFLFISGGEPTCGLVAY